MSCRIMGRNIELCFSKIANMQKFKSKRLLEYKKLQK